MVTAFFLPTSCCGDSWSLWLGAFILLSTHFVYLHDWRRWPRREKAIPWGPDPGFLARDLHKQHSWCCCCLLASYSLCSQPRPWGALLGMSFPGVFGSQVCFQKDSGWTRQAVSHVGLHVFLTVSDLSTHSNLAASLLSTPLDSLIMTRPLSSFTPE